MSKTIDALAAELAAAKIAEDAAIAHRRSLEDELLAVAGLDEPFDGTKTIDADGFEVKAVGRINRTIDGDLLQEIAAEHGLSDHLRSLFRWKPSIAMREWVAADKAITEPLSAAITSRPGRTSISVKATED